MILAVALVSGCTDRERMQGDQSSAREASGGSHRICVLPDSIAEQAQFKPGQISHDVSIHVSLDGTGYAYVERQGTKARVVHNGIPGRWYPVVGDVNLSPDGRRLVYVVAEKETFARVVYNGIAGPPVMEAGMFQFSPDSKYLLYMLKEKDVNYLVVNQKVFRSFNLADQFIISADSRWVAFATAPDTSGRQQFVISDLQLGDVKKFDGCGESFVASDDRSRLAVVCTEKNVRTVKTVDFPGRTVVSTGKPHPEGAIMRLRFGADNRSLAYTFRAGSDGARRYFVHDGKEELIPFGDEFMSDPLVFSGTGGVGAIIGNATTVRLYRAFTSTAKESKKFGFISDFIGSRDLSRYAFTAMNPGGSDAQHMVINGSEGPEYDKIVSPQFTPDGRYVVFRARRNGRRSVVVADQRGAVVKAFKEYDMVFQPVISADGTRIEYTALDGRELWHVVERL